MALAALVAFGFRLSSEPHFVDESAYYSQSYFADLFAAGRWNDPAWLDYPAYDLPPLPKYLIGAGLRLSGYRRPGPSEARAWYANTSTRFDPPGGLVAARGPVVVVGAVGCLAVYGIGCLTAGRSVGLLAAFFLMANPLYRLHARRAMSDVPCEAFLNVGLFFALWCWSRVAAGRGGWKAWAGALGAGVGVGLSLLSKMSGMLFFLVVAAWSILSVLAGVPVARVARYAAIVIVATAVAGPVFAGLNPFLTARSPLPLPEPLASVRKMDLTERARLLFQLRLRVSSDQQHLFPHNAVRTPWEKVSTVAVQGFGRFGPLGPAHSDSTRRFDPAQDRGAVLWLPLVAAGAAWAWRLGSAQRAAGGPPTAWAVLAQFGVALAVVTAYLPMAWDRYLLPIQAPAALLAAGATVAAVARGVRLVRGTSAPPGPLE